MGLLFSDSQVFVTLFHADIYILYCLEKENYLIYQHLFYSVTMVTMKCYVLPQNILVRDTLVCYEHLLKNW